MGRRATGWRVRRRANGYLYVWFTHKGEEHRISLGTRDTGTAARVAPVEYARVVSGQRRTIARGALVGVELDVLLSKWIASKVTSLDPESVEMIESYARKYVAFFRSLDGITESSASAYGGTRLGQVLRTTVLRELMYLRQFLKWCAIEGALLEAPTVPELPKKARGVRSGKQRAAPVEINESEARAIIAQLPVLSKRIDGKKWPLRLRYIVAWGTGLRPETLARLSVPEHWRPGSSTLVLTDEDDKARYGRTVDLTPEVVVALEACATGAGLIFGKHEFSKALKKAALPVIGERKAKDFAAYDFRHGRASTLLDGGAAARGISYVLGHKRPSTLDRYTRPSRRAGREALGITVQYPDNDVMRGADMLGNVAEYLGNRRGLNPRQPESQSTANLEESLGYEDSERHETAENTAQRTAKLTVSGFGNALRVERSIWEWFDAFTESATHPTRSGGV